MVSYCSLAWQYCAYTVRICYRPARRCHRKEDPRWPDGVRLDRTARETAFPPERLPDDSQTTGHFAAPVRVTLQTARSVCGVAAPGGLKGQP